MSQGRIARANRRYPDARRRAARYARTQRGRRPGGLPPHLLPGITRTRKSSHAKLWAAVIAFSGLALAGMAVGFVLFLASTVAAVAATVDEYNDLKGELPDAAGIAIDNFQTSRIFDRDGNLLQEIDDPTTGWRSFVPLDQISDNLINATIAAEDATYWNHYGVEPLAIPRGILISVSGEGSSGGSTITQQLARALFPEQIGFDPLVGLGTDLYGRKVKEAMAAIELERQFSKEDILTMYLNLIFYGERSYGIEAAAQTYFSKHASELSVAEASMLAGLPQLPTDYNPNINFEISKQRQAYVLDQMVKYDYITRAEADEAWDVPLDPQTRNSAVQDSPHFVQYVREHIVDQFGTDALYSGLQITTSIDPDLQDRAEQLVAEGVLNMNVYEAFNGMMVVMVPYTGEVIAMVGSANFEDALIEGQVNIATSPQQPGSAIKPIAYVAAFEAGWNPGTVVMDVPYKRETGAGTAYEPQNYSGLNYGAVTVRTSLSNSLNIPAVKAAEFAGVDNVMDVGKRMGIDFDQPADYYGTSIALGSPEIQPVDLTNAYATFANNGKYVPANPIIKIEDSQGNVLYELDREKVLADATQAISAEHAYQITSILTDDASRAMIFQRGNLFETTQQSLGRPTAAKSGTSNDWVDTWTMGYTTDVAIGVWIGNTNNQPLRETDGIVSAGPIWAKMMQELHSNSEFSELLLGPNERPVAEEFPRPDGIYRGELCAATGHRATGGGSTRTELLVRGEGPALRCDQLSEYERKELEEANQKLRGGQGRFTGDASNSINRYAEATGVRNSGQFYRGDDRREDIEGASSG